MALVLLYGRADVKPDPSPPLKAPLVRPGGLWLMAEYGRGESADRGQIDSLAPALSYGATGRRNPGERRVRIDLPSRGLAGYGDELCVA